MQLQYIGARYIPIFYQNSVDQTANWQINVEYEPLTFVTTQNNHLYLSKKTVPDNIGTPADNTEYWLDMGIFTNAQIAELADEVEALEQRVGANENLGTVDKTTLVNAINEVLSDIGNINNLPYPQADNVVATLNWIHDVIEELRTYTDTQIAHVNDRKYAIVTDSYGGSFGGTITPFTLKFAQYMGLTAGTDYAYMHLDGAGFVSDGRLFTTPLTQLANSMPGDMTPEDITDLMILGGCNDALITSGLGVAIGTTVQTAKSLFPNAKIYIGCIGGFNNLTGRRNILRNVLPYYASCGAQGAIFLPNLQYVMTHGDLYQTDGTHPNQAGMDYIANALMEAVNHGLTVCYQSVINFTGDSAFSLATLRSGFAMQVDQITELEFDTLNFQYPSARNITPGNITLGTYNAQLIKGNINIWIPVVIAWSGGSSGAVQDYGYLALNNGTILMGVLIQRNAKNFAISRVSARFMTLDC